MEINFKNNIVQYSIGFVSILGSGASIYSVSRDGVYAAFVIMFTVTIVLLILFFVFSIKYKKYKNFYIIKKEISTLSNGVKIFFESYTYDMFNDDFEVATNEITDLILNKCTSVMNKLSDKECTSSIMSAQEDLIHFETQKYCANVDIDRLNNKSKSLNGEEGIIGKCIKTGRVQFWSKASNSDNFETIRENYEEFYQSGVSCPILVNGNVSAILNIDTKNPNGFNEYTKDIIMIFASSLSSIYAMIEYEYSNMEEIYENK